MALRFWLTPRTVDGRSSAALASLSNVKHSDNAVNPAGQTLLRSINSPFSACAHIFCYPGLSIAATLRILVSLLAQPRFSIHGVLRAAFNRRLSFGTEQPLPAQSSNQGDAPSADRAGGADMPLFCPHCGHDVLILTNYALVCADCSEVVIPAKLSKGTVESEKPMTTPAPKNALKAML